MQSMGLWSLNHDLTTSLGLSHTPNFSKIHPHLNKCTSVRVHPCTHSQNIKVLKHFSLYDIVVRCSLVWVRSLNHDLTTSLGLSQA
jgi:hypothetical protein